MESDCQFCSCYWSHRLLLPSWLFSRITRTQTHLFFMDFKQVRVQVSGHSMCAHLHTGTMVGGKISVEKCYFSRVNAISSNWTKFKFRCILNQGRHQEIEVGFCQEQSSSLIISFKLVTTIEAGQHVLGTCHLVKS
jgi:hypothetical protein